LGQDFAKNTTFVGLDFGHESLRDAGSARLQPIVRPVPCRAPAVDLPAGQRERRNSCSAKEPFLFPVAHDTTHSERLMGELFIKYHLTCWRKRTTIPEWVFTDRAIGQRRFAGRTIGQMLITAPHSQGLDWLQKSSGLDY
jgi:hypothetical protein